MERIVYVATQLPEELHSDFRWALKLKDATAKDALAELVSDYVKLVKSQVAHSRIRGR